MRYRLLSRWFKRTPEDWFVKLRSAPVTTGVETRFRQWLSADVRNEEAYVRQELTWELAGELEDDDEITAWVADAERTTPRSSHASRVKRAAVWSTAVAGLAALAMTLFWAMPERNVYVTATGEHRTFVLPDRSSMTLNTGSRARIVYERGTRNVYLDRGEATFAVVHDPRRPFEVHAVGVVAKAVGTEFNVYSANGGVTVAVLSGKVLVTATEPQTGQAAGRALVGGGQEVTYEKTRLSNISRANLKRIEAWHSGRIAFEDIGLAAAIAEFNRYGMTPIQLGDPSLASLRVSGVFRVGEQEALLRALTQAFGLHAERTQTAIVLRAGEPARGEVLKPTAEI